MTEREKIIAKIRKLAAMTKANGASESEALKAADMLAKLMAEHHVADTELSLKRDARGCLMGEFRVIDKAKRGVRPNWQKCGARVASLFSCQTYLSSSEEDILGLGFTVPIQIRKFYGFPEDVEAATVLMTIIHTALISASEKQKKREQNDFELGFVDRINVRLQEMIDRKTAAKPTGTSLIVLKDQLVTEEYAKYLRANDIWLGYGARYGEGRNNAAYAAGSAAGSRVDLGGTKLAGGYKQLTSR